MATRYLYDNRGRRRGVIKVWAPKKVGKEEWVCRVQIDGLGNRDVIYTANADALSAILFVFIALKARLKDWEGKRRWIGGEKGDLGLPATVNYGYGHAITKKLERLLQANTRRVVGAALSNFKAKLKKRDRALARSKGARRV
jgi:hypothetical protein